MERSTPTARKISAPTHARRAVDPTSQFDLEFENVVGTGYITAKPTPNDRVVAYVDVRRNEPDLLDGRIQVPPVPFTLGILPSFGPIDGLFLGATYDRTVERRTATAGVGWSHTFGYRNVLNAAVFATGFKRGSDESSLARLRHRYSAHSAALQTIKTKIEQQTYLGASVTPMALAT